MRNMLQMHLSHFCYLAYHSIVLNVKRRICLLVLSGEFALLALRLEFFISKRKACRRQSTSSSVFDTWVFNGCRLFSIARKYY